MATVLITGSSTGIGLATVLAMARAGHAVVATMRKPDGADELRAALTKEDLAVQILPLDVNDDESVANTMGQVLAERGHVDVLVNNAGIPCGGAIEDISMAAFHQVMETNYFGALRCIKAVLPKMRQRRAGCIVNVTSMAGRFVMAAHGGYAASKHALEAASEALAAEVKPFNIRVVIIEPGVIATPIFGKHRPPVPESDYPNLRRLRSMFDAGLEKPVPPSIVGEQIREIVEGDSWRLRYPAGPDAERILRGRAAMSDEEWIDCASSDEVWAAFFKRVAGLDVRH